MSVQIAAAPVLRRSLQDNGEAGKGNSRELSRVWQNVSSSTLGRLYLLRQGSVELSERVVGGRRMKALVPYCLLPFLYS